MILVWKVRDTGVGVPEKYQKHVLHMYITIRANSERVSIYIAMESREQVIGGGH